MRFDSPFKDARLKNSPWGERTLNTSWPSSKAFWELSPEEREAALKAMRDFTNKIKPKEKK